MANEQTYRDAAAHIVEDIMKRTRCGPAVRDEIATYLERLVHRVERDRIIAEAKLLVQNK